MLMLIFAALLIAGAVGWFTSRRTPAPVPAQAGPRSPYPGADPADYGGTNRQVGSQLANAEAEALRSVNRLGSGITALEGAADRTDEARQSIAEAVDRHASSRRQLAEAYTLAQVQHSGRTAVEGLHHLRAARRELGLDPGPEITTER